MAKLSETLTAERVRFLFSYNPSTGDLRWRNPTSHRLAAGDPVGTLASNGRRYVAVDGIKHMAHRVAWFYVYGKWPVGEIDHVNGDSSVNRSCNLREATHQENMSNLSKPKTNRSGRIGVSWHAVGRKWQAHIKVNGENKYLGLFNTVEAAHAAYLEQARLLRGEFARAE